MKRLNSKSKRAQLLVLTSIVLLAVLLVPNVSQAQSSPRFCPTGDAGGSIWTPCLFGFSGGPAGETRIGGLVLNIISILLLVVGSLSTLFLIIGGYRYVTAQGSEEKSEEAKQTMKHAVYGLAIVILSFAVVSIITNVLIRGQGGVF